MKQPKANPVPLPSVLNAESRTVPEDVRNLFCPEYENCLNLAVKRGWASFSCQECPLFTGGLNNWDQQMVGYATSRRAGG